MMRHYNWFTARRNRDHRNGHQGPVCSRHGHMRYDEAGESSDNSSEEERRERRRRRELRSRLREEDEDFRTEREKKRSTRSRICAWLNCFCGILIVLGLVFVFYVITTLIIDGSSPLDFISFSNNNTSTNSTNSQNFNNPLDASILNGINKRTTNSKETVTRGKPTIDPVSTTLRTSTKNSEKNSFGKTLGKNDTKNVFESNIKNHQPGLEVGRTRISYVKGSDGRSYIAFVPVRSDDTSSDKPFEEKKDEIIVNRNGQTSLWDEYDSRRSYEDFREPQTIKRPSRNRDNYAYRRPSDSYEIGSKLIPQYVPPPNNNRRMKENNNPLLNRRRFVASPADRRTDSPLRRPPYSREIENNNRRYRPHRRTYPPGEGRQFVRNQYRNSPTPPEEYVVKPYPRGRNSPGHEKRGRFIPDVTREYNSPSEEIKRPPKDFQYPSSAGNIQDIIEYMKNKDRTENRRIQNPGFNNPYKNHDRVNKFSDPSEYYLGNQDHVIGYEDTDETSHYIDTDVLEDRNPYEPGKYDRDNFDKYHKTTKYIDHSQSYDSAYDSNPLPPVVNTYDTKGSGRDSRSGKPLRLILDIYPIDSHSKSSLADIYQSSVSVEEDLHQRNLNFPYKFQESNKKEIILRVNLLTEQPTHRSEPELRDRSLSLEIPLKGGSLTPHDIYKAIVDYVRKSPVAARQRVSGYDSPKPHDQIANDFLTNAEENHQLLGAIEHGLRELNTHLPEAHQFTVDTKSQNISQNPQKFSLERSPRSSD
ncbi:UNVERIFIED_CONTAM: hypothetical protein RMT77_008166 [Armadillidium vulgare]